MNSNLQGRRGHTLIEVMGALLLVTMFVAMAVGGWSYFIRGLRVTSVQNELDIDVRVSMSRLRTDLRLSSTDEMFFYPDGPGPYTAISFPLPDVRNGQVVMVDGKIQWGSQIIYHIRQATPNQLCRTVFSPRDNNLSSQQRKDQLASVVATGDGYSTYNGYNAETHTIFANLFDWNIWARGGQFDSYSPDPYRKNVSLGSVVLSPGTHRFEFRVVGKNSMSQGYKLGFDSFSASPCGLEREAEAQTVVAQVGATPFVQLMNQGSWGGNYQLSFPASADGHSFTVTMDNDRWEETNFRHSSAVFKDTELTFSGTPLDFVISPRPETNAWMAVWQTLASYKQELKDDTLQNKAVRVLVRGGTMQDGGSIKYKAKIHCIHFRSPGGMKITHARIAQAASHTNATPDIYDSGTELNLIHDAYGRLTRGEPVTEFFVDTELSYIVSFILEDNAASCWVDYWRETRTNAPPPSSYYIPNPNPGASAIAGQLTWSGDSNLVEDLRLFAVEKIHIHATNGTFTSQIVDTRIDYPSYKAISWNADLNGGTINVRVRTSNNPDMSGAPDWASISPYTAPGSMTSGSGRYIQFQAELLSPDGRKIPYLKDVTIEWDGETRVVDVGGVVTMGPEQGMFQLLIDDVAPRKGVSIDLTIFKDVISLAGGSSRLTSTMTAEVQPKNTGR